MHDMDLPGEPGEPGEKAVRERWPQWPPRGGVSISFTSLGQYDECPRRWLNQYASDLLPRAQQWGIRAQAKLSPWDALAGRIVDDTIRWALKQYMESGQWPDNLTDKAIEIRTGYVQFTNEFRRAVQDNRKWPRSLNQQPVDRLFFRDTLTKGEVRKVNETVGMCLANFETSIIRGFLEGFPVSEWVIPERLDNEAATPWFWSGDAPVYANFDFAIRSKELTMIFDWKTGRKTAQSEAKVCEQLHTYAEHAALEWGTPYEKILLFPVWLAYELDLEPIPLSEGVLEKARVKWQARHVLLKSSLEACRQDPARVAELFPMNGYPTRCERCAFRDCEGYLRWNGAEDIAVVREARAEIYTDESAQPEEPPDSSWI